MNFSETDIKYLSKVLADTKEGLTGNEIISYFVYMGFKYNVNIPCRTQPFVDSSERRLNKASAFEKNLLAFSDLQQEVIIYTLLFLPKFENNPKVKEILKRYSLEDDKITYLKEYSELDKYADVKKLYLKAVEPILNKNINDERTILDNLRLSVELLLRHIFKNKHSLEKQKDNFKNYILSRTIPEDLKNTYIKTFNYYIEYQNKNVKHNLPSGDLEQQVKAVFNMTNLLITLFI